MKRIPGKVLLLISISGNKFTVEVECVIEFIRLTLLTV